MKKCKDVMDSARLDRGFESVDPVSETVPNEVLSIGEMLNRMAHGMPVTGGRMDGVFGDVGDEDFDDHDLGKIRNMDLTEIDDLRTEAEEVQEAWDLAKAKHQEEKKKASQKGKPKEPEKVEEVEEESATEE